MDTCLYDYLTAEGIKKDINASCRQQLYSYLNFTLPLNDSAKTFYLVRHNGQIDSLHFEYKLRFSAQNNCGFTSNIQFLKIDSFKSSIKGNSWHAETHDSIPMRFSWGPDYDY